MNRQGYSLIELLVVMGMMAVITGLSIINFRNAEYADELRLAGRNLASELRRAQTFALLGQTAQFCRSDDVNNTEQGKLCPSGNNLECGVNGFCVVDTPPGGYCVRLDSVSDGRQAMFFADLGNRFFDFNGPDGRMQEQELQRSLSYAFGENVELSELDPVDNGILDICFQAPRPTALYNGVSTFPMAKVTLTHARSGNQALVTVNGISGQVSVEMVQAP